MQHYLLVNTLIEASSDVIHTFTKLSKASGCHIVESHFTVLGKEIAITLFLSGTWDTIAKVEDILMKLETKHQIKILTKRTKLEVPSSNAIPYAIDIVGLDQVGIIFDITEFMTLNGLVIQGMASSIYSASQTGAKMFALHITVHISLDLSIAAIRGDFMEFCDQFNLDAIMEPVK